MGSCQSDRERYICVEGTLGPEFAGFRVRVCGDSCNELTKLISDCAVKTIDTLKLFGKSIGRLIGKLFLFLGLGNVLDLIYLGKQNMINL